MAAHGNVLDGQFHMHRGWRIHLVPLVAGGLTFAAAQSWLLAVSTGSGTADPGWFLNGREAGLALLTTVALVSALIAAFRPGSWIAGAAAFTAGAAIALTIVLFSIGAGTIFPIVIALGTVVLAGAVFAGAGVGWLLRLAWTRRTS